ncbi:hypothetical protein [Amycolatopsis japonica]|uniref:hypothetical protein n=1 Tax=Amycolatopsis japonica TaxID=208439 RepID=UPI000A8D7834|nr:hypothetical protein [Amycolatopsis japonica]
MKGPGLLVVLLVVLGGVSGLGFLLGLGNAAVLAALTALFCLIAAVGGPLWADLRLLAWFAPALILAVGVPRLLGAVSQWAAIGLLVAIVVVAGLVPVLGPRFVTVGLGLGMASLFGYGFQLTGTASAGQILGAPAIAVGVVILLRVLMGAKDPAKPTRDALADALSTGTSETQVRAARLWLADRPRRWTGGGPRRPVPVSRGHGVAGDPPETSGQQGNRRNTRRRHGRSRQAGRSRPKPRCAERRRTGAA